MRVFDLLPEIGVRETAAPRFRIDTHDLVTRHRRDWFRILAELQAAGFSNAEVARALKLRDSTIRNWKYGIEPMHSKGEALLELHKRIARRRRRKLAKEQATAQTTAQTANQPRPAGKARKRGVARL